MLQATVAVTEDNVGAHDADVLAIDAVLFKPNATADCFWPNAQAANASCTRLSTHAAGCKKRSSSPKADTAVGSN